MAEVQFQEEQSYIPTQGQLSFMIRLVLRTGLARNKRSAQYMLLAIALVAFIISGFFLFGGTSENTSDKFIERAQQVDQRQFVQP